MDASPIVSATGSWSKRDHSAEGAVVNGDSHRLFVRVRPGWITCSVLLGGCVVEARHRVPAARLADLVDELRTSRVRLVDDQEDAVGGLAPPVEPAGASPGTASGRSGTVAHYCPCVVRLALGDGLAGEVSVLRRRAPGEAALLVLEGVDEFVGQRPRSMVGVSESLTITMLSLPGA